MKKLSIKSLVIMFMILGLYVRSQSELKPVVEKIDTSSKDVVIIPGNYLTKKGDVWIRLLALKKSGDKEYAVFSISDEDHNIQLKIKNDESLYAILGGEKHTTSEVTFIGILSDGNGYFKVRKKI